MSKIYHPPHNTTSEVGQMTGTPREIAWLLGTEKHEEVDAKLERIGLIITYVHHNCLVTVTSTKYGLGENFAEHPLLVMDGTNETRFGENTSWEELAHTYLEEHQRRHEKEITGNVLWLDWGITSARVHDYNNGTIWIMPANAPITEIAARIDSIFSQPVRD